MSTAATWIWFGLSWAFLLAVIFKHWFAREHRDAEATEAALSRTRRTAGREYEQDAM